MLAVRLGVLVGSVSCSVVLVLCLVVWVLGFWVLAGSEPSPPGCFDLAMCYGVLTGDEGLRRGS
jgi:hypothetical protein